MRIRYFSVLLAVASLAVTARADRQSPVVMGDPPLTLNGTWVTLDENMTTGSFFTGDYTWTSADPVLFTITDWAVVTDQFDVYDNSSFVFATSNKPDWTVIDPGGTAMGSTWRGDADSALASGNFSSGTWVFAPGSHSLTIKDTHIPPVTVGGTAFPDGTVAFKAEVVPLPPAAWLGTCVLGVLGARRGLKAYFARSVA